MKKSNVEGGLGIILLPVLVLYFVCKCNQISLRINKGIYFNPKYTFF